jgi:hypothetical protein
MLWVSTRRVSNEVQIKVFYAARTKRRLEAGLTRLAQACGEDDEGSGRRAVDREFLLHLHACLVRRPDYRQRNVMDEHRRRDCLRGAKSPMHPGRHHRYRRYADQRSRHGDAVGMRAQCKRAGELRCARCRVCEEHAPSPGRRRAYRISCHRDTFGTDCTACLVHS